MATSSSGFCAIFLATSVGISLLLPVAPAELTFTGLVWVTGPSQAQ